MSVAIVILVINLSAGNNWSDIRDGLYMILGNVPLALALCGFFNIGCLTDSILYVSGSITLITVLLLIQNLKEPFKKTFLDNQ